MTLNDLEYHFTLKSVLFSASNGFACSGFQTKLFENLQSYTPCLKKLYKIIFVHTLSNFHQLWKLLT